MKIDLIGPARFLTLPYGVVIVSVLLSFAAWLVPPSVSLSMAFDYPEPLFSPGGAMLLGWYASILVLSYASFFLGRRIVAGTDFFNRYANLNDRGIYLALTSVATAGVGYTTWFVFHRLGLAGVWEALTESNGNLFHDVIYENYTHGFFSLRLVIILSAGMTIYRLISKQPFHWFSFLLDALNIVMLFLAILYSSRLTMIAALVFGFTLHFFQRKHLKVNILKLGLLLVGLFILLAIFNNVRNGNYYRARGFYNIYQANLSEIIRYLSAPFQTSLATGNKYDAAVKGVDFPLLAGVDPGLNANSAFFQLTHLEGTIAWPHMWTIIVITSFFMGVLSHHYRNYLFLSYLAMLYAYAEIWRLYFFDVGVYKVLLFGPLLLAGSMSLFYANFPRKFRKILWEEPIENDIPETLEPKLRERPHVISVPRSAR